jgi:uncharacterized protein with FMN-binding domain
MPKRGAAALLLTTFALILLLNFQTPSDSGTRFALRPGSAGAAVAPFVAPTTGQGSDSSQGSGGGSGAGSGSGAGTGSGSNSSGSGAAAQSPAAGSGSGSGSGAAGSQPGATQAPKSGSSHPGNATVTGQDIQTRFGDVQVQVTISNGKIVDITPLTLPFDRQRSAEISQYVEPILRSEALSAQSAQIDIVSGATYTSMAYAQSLQSALDQAHG